MAVDNFIDFINTVKKWQTLIAGLLALGAATLSVRTIKKQIQQDKDIHEETKKRKAFAARAYMPDAVSKLLEYSKECFSYLENPSHALPCPPSDAITVFKNSIEFIDTDTAAAIFEMVVFYQVHNACLFSYEKESIEEKGDDYDQAIFDLILLTYHFCSIFEYARNEKEKIILGKPTVEEMETAGRQLDMSWNIEGIIKRDGVQSKIDHYCNK